MIRFSYQTHLCFKNTIKLPNYSWPALCACIYFAYSLLWVYKMAQLTIQWQPRLPPFIYTSLWNERITLRERESGRRRVDSQDEGSAPRLYPAGRRAVDYCWYNLWITFIILLARDFLSPVFLRSLHQPTECLDKEGTCTKRGMKSDRKSFSSALVLSEKSYRYIWRRLLWLWCDDSSMTIGYLCYWD